MTGEFPSAGTDSNVFITIFGEMGDTGKRWLKNTEDGETPFAKGRVSTPFPGIIELASNLHTAMIQSINLKHFLASHGS